MVIEKRTAQRIQQTKYQLGLKSADETINRMFDIARRITTADNYLSDELLKVSRNKQSRKTTDKLMGGSK